MNIFTKQKQTHRHIKQIYGYQREKGLGRNKLGACIFAWESHGQRSLVASVHGVANSRTRLSNFTFGISRYKPLNIKQMILLYSTGNYTQYPVITHNGKVHISLSFLDTRN